MAADAAPDTIRRIAPSDLVTFVEAAFSAVDVPTPDARLMADALVDADLRGVHSHGTRWTPNYVSFVQNGSTKARPIVVRAHDDETTAIVDGDHGLGHVVASIANDLAIEKALAHGVGVVTLRHGTHCGAMAYYTNRAAERGCLGFSATNGNANMAPPGGVTARIGNNPLSYSFPTPRGFPVALDMATSVVAGSKLLMAMDRGEKVPLGWALDSQGRPTDDPRDWRERGGTLAPIAGPKGFGLALVLEILTGVLSGGQFGARRSDRPGNTSTCQVFTAISIERFMPLPRFLERMDTLIGQIKESALAPGSTGVYVPGELEHIAKTDRLTHGIPLAQVTIDSLHKLADSLGLPRVPTT